MASDGTGMSFKQVQLWGGAADMAVPERLIDVSGIRPVPDNQEVDFIWKSVLCWLRDVYCTFHAMRSLRYSQAR